MPAPGIGTGKTLRHPPKPLRPPIGGLRQPPTGPRVFPRPPIRGPRGPGIVGVLLLVLPPLVDWLLKNPPWRKPEPPGTKIQVPNEGYCQVLLTCELWNDLSPGSLQYIDQTSGFNVEGGGSFWIPEDVTVELRASTFGDPSRDFGMPRVKVIDSAGERDGGSWPLSASLAVPSKSGTYSTSLNDPQIGYAYGRRYKIKSLRWLGDGSQIRPTPLPAIKPPPLTLPDRPEPDRSPQPGPLIPAPLPKPLRPAKPSPDRQPAPAPLPTPERKPAKPARNPDAEPENEPKPSPRPDTPKRPPGPANPPERKKDPNDNNNPRPGVKDLQPVRDNGTLRDPAPEPARPTPRDQHLTKDGPVTGNGPQPNLEDIARELGRLEQKLAKIIDRVTPQQGGPLDIGDLLQILELIRDLLTNNVSGTIYEVEAACTIRGEDEPQRHTIEVPGGLDKNMAAIARLDAIAELIGAAQLLKQATCGRNTSTPGNNVTVTAYEVIKE